jgi:hypothetical protein
MNKRQLKHRIFAEYAYYVSDSPENRAKKPLEQRMDDLLLMSCKYKEPSRAQRSRFNDAKHEVLMILWNHSGLK